MKKHGRIWLFASLSLMCVVVVFSGLSSRLIWASGNPVVAGSYHLYKTSGLTVVLVKQTEAKGSISSDGVYIAARVDRIAVAEHIIVGHVRSSPASVEYKNEMPGYFVLDWRTDELLGSGLDSLEDAESLVSRHLGKEINISLKAVL